MVDESFSVLHVGQSSALKYPVYQTLYRPEINLGLKALPGRSLINFTLLFTRQKMLSPSQGETTFKQLQLEFDFAIN